MGPRSLSTRLLASVSILLIVFFGITIAALDFAFRRVTEQAMHDRLEAQMLALISASEEDDSGGLQPGVRRTLAASSRGRRRGWVARLMTRP